MASVISDITSSSYLQIVRLKTKDKHKQVGIKIPELCVYKVQEELKQMDMSVKRRHEESRQNAQRQSLPPLPSASLPLDLSFPLFQSAPFSEPDILDLTYSPPPPPQEQHGYPFPETLGSILSNDILLTESVNVKEIIEEMLQKAKEPSAADRQSVIQYGGEHNFWGMG